MTKAVILGSAQDGGSPQLGGPDRPRRLVTSVAVIGDGGSTLLLDVSPDIREQAAGLSHHRPPRSSGNVVDHIALTHAHMGHYTGLVQFGREAHNSEEVPTWVTASMASFLTVNQPWAQLIENRNLDLRIVEPGVVEGLGSGLSIRFVFVPHRAEMTDTVGISVNDYLLYLPDIDSWGQWTAAEATIGSHQVALVDAAFAGLDEVPGRDLAEIPHPLVGDTLDRFAHLTGGTRIILTHLNHSNPLTDPLHPMHDEVAEAGFEVASDGQVIDFGD
jgi:pyrroloquinoline quinone biosynthesis protein B